MAEPEFPTQADAAPVAIGDDRERLVAGTEGSERALTRQAAGGGAVASLRVERASGSARGRRSRRARAGPRVATATAQTVAVDEVSSGRRAV